MTDHRPTGRQREALHALARATRMLERSASELSLPHYRVLAAIAAGDERASRVAARLALGKPTISASVDALCKRGLLQRGEVAGDQRAAALRTTEAGNALLARTEAEMGARLEAVLTRANDPAAILSALADLGAALDAVADERLAALTSTGKADAAQ